MITFRARNSSLGPTKVEYTVNLVTLNIIEAVDENFHLPTPPISIFTVEMRLVLSILVTKLRKQTSLSSDFVRFSHVFISIKVLPSATV